MKYLQRIAMAAVTALLLSACASTGGGHWTNDWRNCMAAGVLAGSVVGGVDSAEDARDGALIGGVIGSLVCALKHKDSDGDGISDDADRCPNTVEGAEVDQNGCELDFDGDGVVDRLDQCPDTPSGVSVDANGCELDSDNDGVANSKDQCPGTPAGAVVDSNGCELDGDGDGVVDRLDQCPDTEQGQAVDNNGCDLAEHHSLNGIYFEYDSARLTADSLAAINEALQILHRKDDLVVEVAGHTDSKGTESYNQALSERRAAAVMKELVAGGIDASRLSSKGYGESEPIADNASDAGRAKNRRVELRQK